MDTCLEFDHKVVGRSEDCDSFKTDDEYQADAEEKVELKSILKDKDKTNIKNKQIL
jgi:hypothetical protein